MIHIDSNMVDYVRYVFLLHLESENIPNLSVSIQKARVSTTKTYDSNRAFLYTKLT